MASIIRVKRSTGTVAPLSLEYGELAYTVGVGTHGNSGGRLFVGDFSENTLVIGGRYFADLLSIGPGLVAGQSNPTTAANGFVAILDQDRKVNQWNVDNLTLDGNTLSSSNNDGDVILDPNGTGEILVPDDTYLTFGTSKDAKIKYDEASSDKVEVSGSDWRFATGVQINIEDTTNSGSTSSGALIVSGGAGIGLNLSVGGDTVLTGDLKINGGDLTSDLTQFNILTSSVLGANVLTSANNITIGSASGITSIRNALLDIGGRVNIGGTSITTDEATFALLNGSVINAEVLGQAQSIVLGATSGVTTIRNATVDLDGDLNIDGGDITSNQTLFNFLNANVTSANLLNAASSIVLGGTTGITTIRNEATQFTNTSQSGYVSIAATTDASSTTTGALRVAGGVGLASDLYVGGELWIEGAANITGDTTFTNSVTVQKNLTVNGNSTLGNSSTDSIYVTGITTVTGAIYQVGTFNNIGGATIDNIGISSNVISTRSGAGNVLYIDPYPDGLSNEGTVVIKGDLQVDGTTTSVNSNTVTVDDPILNLGNVTLQRTVMSPALAGVSTIRLDSVIGINTADVVTGNANLSLSGITTVTSVDYNNKIISVEDTVLVGGISTGSQLTITTAYDTNTDRGISFNYNTSSGAANNKVGFFGYHDQTGNWTYIPDASIANSVAAGVKGTLDVGALLLDWAVSGISTRGSAYFNANGKLVSTGTPETTFVSNSNYILTTDGSNVPVWTDTLDGGTF